MKLPFFPQKRRLVVAETPKKPGRPPGSHDKTPRRRRTPAEIENDRFLKDLKAADPAAYRKLMLARLGIGPEAEGGEIDRVLATLEKLDRLDQLRGRRDEGGDRLGQMLAAFAPVLLAQMQQNTPGQTRPRPATATAPALAAAPATATPENPPDAASPAPSEEAAAPGWLDSLKRRGAAMIAQAELGACATPADAAAWLQGKADSDDEQTAQAAAGMIALIRDTPDDRLIAALQAQAEQIPEFDGLMNWLAEREVWTIQVAHALRGNVTPLARQRAPKAQ